MSQRTAWETLVANALMGTDRQPPKLPTVEGALQGLLAQLSTHPEDTVLQAAATIACYQQAGQCPWANGDGLPTPSRSENQSRCNELTYQHLQTILSGEYQKVLPELLTLMAQAQQRVPEEMLPALLNLGRGQTGLRSQIQAVIGERGRWLATQNSVWSYAMGHPLPPTETGEIDQEAVENLWKTSDYPIRLDLLKTLRNLNPDAARDLLSTTWKQEKAKDRATFLAEFHSQLSLADEPFLDAALQDRAQDVRTCASHLLAHLPLSQFCQRMAEHGQTYVKFQDMAKVDIQLPPTDDTWKNEGLQSQQGKLGRRTNLLMQIVAAVPLNSWPSNPHHLIQVVCTHQHSLALLQGWTVATQRQANQTWAKAMIEYWLNQSDTQALDPVALILDLLPTPEVESLLLKWLTRFRSQPSVWQEAMYCVIQLSSAPSLELSQSIWGMLKAEVTYQLANSKNAYQLRSFLQAVAYYLHPRLADDVTAYINTLDIDLLTTYQQDSLVEWQNILHFRQAMGAEF